MLQNKFTFEEATDSFLNITSRYLPIHSDFINFWETSVTGPIDSELEVDEVCSLFKLWPSKMTNGNINEETVIKILKHFFPNVVIIEDKYILNVSCILWDKNKDITDSIEYIKEQVNNNYKLALISFDDAYNYYYKFCVLQSKKLIVSKRFFEKFLYINLSQHIVYEKFIETEWFTAKS